jgi:hypothetical protein
MTPACRQQQVDKAVRREPDKPSAAAMAAPKLGAATASAAAECKPAADSGCSAPSDAAENRTLNSALTDAAKRLQLVLKQQQQPQKQQQPPQPQQAANGHAYLGGKPFEVKRQPLAGYKPAVLAAAGSKPSAALPKLDVAVLPLPRPAAGAAAASHAHAHRAGSPQLAVQTYEISPQK